MRGIQVLQDVDTIAAEDTRHTGKLLHHFQIKTPQISYHQHNEQQRIPELIGQLQAGKSIALVTDAGMPGISDPGYLIVAACVAAGIRVIPIPGVTAVITAVSASGLPSDRFAFEGFLPAKGQERKDWSATIPPNDPPVTSASRRIPRWRISASWARAWSSVVSRGKAPSG